MGGPGAREEEEDAAATSPQRPALTPQYPCVGVVESASRQLLVVGTAHVPCRSALEVSAVITKAEPDAVVVELDQERLENLLRRTDTDPGSRQYGEDFAAAVRAADAVGAPIVLGDAKIQDTFSLIRAPGAIVDTERLARGFQLAVDRIRRIQPPEVRLQRISELGSLADDPGKWLPILGSLWWAVLLTPFVALQDPVPDGGVGEDLWAAACAGMLLLSSRVVDVVLLNRDEVLSGSALRAVEMADGLRDGRLLRRRYTYGTDPATLAAAPGPPPRSVPFFTLRRPLARGEMRRLNLFEPRWLCLLDSLAAYTKPYGTAEAPPLVERLLGTTFGAVFAVNRFYAVADNASAGDSGLRTADVVIRPVARRARIVRARQGTRPVSGDRRVEVWIEGGEPLSLDAASLAPTGRGYLAAEVSAITEVEYEAALGGLPLADPGVAGGDGSNGDTSTRPTRVVAVVGLAHANGVLDRCAKQFLRDEPASYSAEESESEGG